MSTGSLHLNIPKPILLLSTEKNALFRDTFLTQIMSAADLENHFDKVLINLSSLNKMPLNGDERLELTERLINNYLLFIRQVRSGQLLLSKKHRVNLPDLNREFTYATKLILRDAISHSKDELANYVYWTISSICEQLSDYSEASRVQPQQLWGELNQLYQFAETRFLTDFQNNKPDHRDIESRYKQALLFNASQPEHLNRSEQTLINGYLYKWAFRGQLLKLEDNDLNAHSFYADLDSTTGVQTSRQMKVAKKRDNIRVVNPLPIIEQTRQHMKQLRAGTTPNKIGFANSVDPIDAFMTLKKVLAAWKQSNSRRFERAGCAVQAKTALGLETIHSFLKSPKSVNEKLIPTETVNTGKTGAAINITTKSNGPRLAVGDVVMHQQDDQTPAQLAIVRWLKRSSTTISFGVEFVFGNLQPVTLSVRDKTSDALLLSTSDNDSLITSKGYCTSNTTVKLNNLRHGIELNAKAQSLMQRGLRVDQIRIKRSHAA